MEHNEPAQSRYKWTSEYNIRPRGYSTEVDEEYFGEDTPHKPPVLDVDLKLAADIEIVDDDELVEEVAEYWFPSEKSRYNKAAAIIFNDVSVWYLPLANWDEDYEHTRVKIIDDFIEDIIQWRAIVDGRSPEKALEDWRDWKEPNVKQWVKELDDTELSEEYRNWFNNNVDWVSHISKTIESNSHEVELDLNDEDDWTEEW